MAQDFLSIWMITTDTSESFLIIHSLVISKYHISITLGNAKALSCTRNWMHKAQGDLNTIYNSYFKSYCAFYMMIFFLLLTMTNLLYVVIEYGSSNSKDSIGDVEKIVPAMQNARLMFMFIF